ncbi:MAG: hypothetical protein HRU15_16910 [Planctomycetes bacterium]|nr:hypothetical protein [Planctomycetota bacterium]
MTASQIFTTTIISSAILATCMFNSTLMAADSADLLEEDSIKESGKWSESVIAKGQNQRIDEEALKSLPNNIRNIWGTEADKEVAKAARGKRRSGERIVDQVIPAFGVTYVTQQRDYSRGENLFHRVHRFLTDVNIRIMAGELGRRGPKLVPATDAKGRKVKNGDVKLLEREPLPEEVQIRTFYDELVNLQKVVAFPNTAERNHFNEIAGDLNKAQGLLNFDLTEEGIKTIDEQYAAWTVLIEVEKQKAMEVLTKQIMEEEEADYRRARRAAEKQGVTFRLPPLPMGEHALRDARAELNRMGDVNAAQKTKNAKTKRVEKAKEEIEEPRDVKAEESAVVEEVEETKEGLGELDEVKEFDVDDEVVEDAMEEEVVEEAAEEVAEEVVEEAAAEVDVEADMEEEVVEEAAPAKEEKKEEAAEEDDFEFEDDF